MKVFRLFVSAVMAVAVCAGQTPAKGPAGPSLPPLETLKVPARPGIVGETSISLGEVIQRVLANDRDLEVSRILREEAGLNISAAKGYYDPRIGLNAYRVKSVTPTASLIGGAANGKVTQKELYADPQLNGLSPWLGGSYKLDFSSARQSTDSTFVTLNPQFPTALTLNLTQPLWRGLRFDENRHRLQVARKNFTLSGQQLRQRVIEVVTQAIQAYWELSFAYWNLGVQIEAVRLAEQQDSSNRRQVAQGLLAPVDVIQTRTQIATFQENVFAAQESLTRAENALKTMILPDRSAVMWNVGLVPETQISTGLPVVSLPDEIRRALEQRPEIEQSRIDVDLNRLDSRLAEEQVRPQINALANFSLQGLSGRALPPAPNPLTGNTSGLTDLLNELAVRAGLPTIPPFSFGSGQVPPIFPGGYSQSLSNLTSGYFPTVQVGVQVSLPLHNRTAMAQRAVSAQEGKRVKALQQQIELAIVADVRNSVQSVAAAQSRLDSAVVARQSAEEQYASERRQFQAGTSSVFLVLQRQTDLIAARSREIRAKADLGKAAADLDRATARTIESQKIQLALP